MDQPTVDGFNTFVVSRAARRAGLTVALSGLGGDELFGGYASFRDVPRAAALRRLFPFTLQSPAGPSLGRPCSRQGHRQGARAARQGPPRRSRHTSLRRELLLPAERRTLYNGSLPPLAVDRALPPDLSSLSEVNQVSALEISSYMRDMLLRDGDVFSMAVGLELRLPLLDHVFVESAVKLPGRWKAPTLGRSRCCSMQSAPAFRFRPRAPETRVHLPVGCLAARPDARSGRTGRPPGGRLARAQFERSAPARLWRRFEDGDPRVRGLQVVAFWVLQEYVTRNQLSVASRSRVLSFNPVARLGGAEQSLVDLLSCLAGQVELGSATFEDGPLVQIARGLGVRTSTLLLPESLMRLGDFGESGALTPLLKLLTRNSPGEIAGLLDDSGPP